MSLFRLTTVRLAGLAGLLALPLLAGCAYDDGYYPPPSGYGYGYGSYGYGGYGYYGNPCWPYGCDDYHHHHHHWGDDDNDGHHSHRGSGMTDGSPPRPPIAGNHPPSQPGPGRRRPPSAPFPLWQQKDSKN